MFIDSEDLDIWKNELYSELKLLDQSDEFLASQIEFKIEEEENRSHINRKSDKRSAELRLKGNEKVSKNMWREAMKLYNKSLCEAKVDSENISLAYANRSLCFLKLEMYDKCLTDIELAIDAKYPEQSISKLDERRTYCLKQIKEGIQATKKEPKLDFEEDEQFPGMANVLKFQYNEKYKRHLIAKCDIDVGKIVLVEEAFVATPVMSTVVVVCSNCFKVTMNFIACENCEDAMFCSSACAKNDKFHVISCGNSIFNSDHLVPYAVRSVLFALSIFPDIDSLIRFVKSVLNEDKNKVPVSTADMESKYRSFLKLNFHLEDEERYYMDNRPLELYVELMSHADVKEKIRSKNDERFLMFLSVIHLNILFCNSFQNKVAGFIFLIYKHINQNIHAPNLLQNTLNNKMVLTTSRPIKRGDQLFIPFDGNCCVVQSRFKSVIYTKLYGESHIMARGCNILERIKDQPMSLKHIKTDPDYQYIQDEMKLVDYNDDLKCSLLRQKCLEFMIKYQEMPWNAELKDVSRIFENL